MFDSGSEMSLPAENIVYGPVQWLENYLLQPAETSGDTHSVEVRIFVLYIVMIVQTVKVKRGLV